jgi:2-dehydro-3-deoxyphosphooctonate aldolase (KDO 8-P synthase)
MDLNSITSQPNFFLIAGPCAIEDEKSPLEIAKAIKSICVRHNIPFIFKGSFRKANRTKLDSFTGIGDEKALKVLHNIKTELNIPVLTDIHEAHEADMAAPFVDILQIPAFLCRQTELLLAAGKTGKIVNIKKAQFLEADSMQFALEKVKSTNNDQIWLTERGTAFGYKDLVVDFTGIPTMKAIAPTILDCTHSMQQPNQTSGVTGGKPEKIETIAKAGIAAGVDGLFIETHPNPDNAKSDGANMLPLDQLEALLVKLVKIRSVL